MRVRAEELPKVLGAYAAILWTRYGLPMEVARDITREYGFDLDEETFHKCMDIHRERSKAVPGSTSTESRRF